ncbi:MAG TPA: NAD(P)/FAD-dependent oxidoreductase [Actinomycetota bacterium]|nr:NAD(P)/FAD-dependent oxidoreductase [Actinomycetota bacterium]
MAGSYHAIVVGGGHNGLVAGAYLAKAGAQTVVLEARSKVGGAVDTSAPFPNHPEISVSTYSYVMSLMPAFIIEELGLTRHGYHVTPFGPYYQAFPDGRSISIYGDDAEKTYASVARFSVKDAETLPEYEAWIHGITEVVGPLLHRVPPNVGSMSFGDLLAQSKAGWTMRQLGTRGIADATRLFTMSLSELLDRWFESEQMKTIMMVDGLIGQWSGPDEPGTAYVLLHHAIGGVGGGESHTVNWGFPRGGMGSVADAMRDAATSYGCEIRTEARVRRILVEDGRAVGVALESGEELRAPIVVSCIHPKIAFLELIERAQLPEDFVFDIESWKSRSGVVKINLAMSELPDFSADPGTDLQDHHTGSVELCLSREYAERAFQDAHLEHRAATAPFVDGAIPTTIDTDLAPEGVQVFSMFSQWVPHEWNAEPHRDELEAFADRAIDGYTELAPNFRDAVIDRQVIGPFDMEQELGLVGGNIFHGELTVDQLFHMRPSPGYADYRTPIAGLYHGSSATHAGGGVNGVPGWQAYRAARADHRRRGARIRRRR